MTTDITKIIDTITPEIYQSYMDQYSTEKSALIQSGIAVADPRVSQNITAGGTVVNMPFWNDLSGEDEVLGNGDEALSTGKIQAAADMACVMYRGRGWSVNELTTIISGDDPVGAILRRINDYWLRREQQVLFSVLNGIFGDSSKKGTLYTTHVLDAAAKGINGELVLDAKQLLGDAADQLVAIGMHSAVYTQLQKQNLIVFIPDSEGKINIPTYLGYRVLIDDGIAPKDGVYNTYLFRRGSIGRNVGNPAALTAFETARDAAKGNDDIFTRRAFTMHPYGVKWKNNKVEGVTPANKELANKDNWERVYDPKNIGIICIKHALTTPTPVTNVEE